MDWLNLIANSAILQTLAQTLMHFIWQGTLLAVALFVLLKTIDIRHSELRYSVSLGALLLCVIAPVSTFWFLYQPQILAPSVDVGQVLNGVSTTVIQAGGSLSESGYLSLSLLTTELLDYFNLQNMLAILPFVALAWLCSVTVLSGRVLLQMVGVCQLPHQATHSPEPQLQRVFVRLLLQLNVTAKARLYISDKIDVPMAIGWLKPVVLLPSSMVLGLTPGQLEMLLVHELAHVRRHDYLVNFVQTLVELMLFFHPGVKWISKQIRLERECCCDNIAVSHSGSPVAYASTLTDAEMSRSHHIPDLAMAASGSDLKQRILRVVGHADCAGGRNRTRFTAVLAAVISLTSVVVVLVSNHDDANSKVVKNNAISSEKLVAEHSAQSSAAEHAGDITPQDQQPETQTEAEPEVSLGASTPSEALSAQQELADAENEREISQELTQIPASDVEVSDVEVSDVEVMASVQNDSDPNERAEVSESAAVPSDSPPEESAKSSAVDYIAATEGAISAEVKPSAVVSAASTLEGHKIIAVAEKTAAPVEQVDATPAVLLEGETPAYPRQALRRKITEDVEVSFVVNTQGQVENIAFNGDAHRSFRKSITRALQNWHFAPAQQNGNAVTSQITRIFSFIEPENNNLTTTGTRIFSN